MLPGCIQVPASTNMTFARTVINPRGVRGNPRSFQNLSATPMRRNLQTRTRYFVPNLTPIGPRNLRIYPTLTNTNRPLQTLNSRKNRPRRKNQTRTSQMLTTNTPLKANTIFQTYFNISCLLWSIFMLFILIYEAQCLNKTFGRNVLSTHLLS